jgi:hypothetical protein
VEQEVCVFMGVVEQEHSASQASKESFDRTPVERVTGSR